MIMKIASCTLQDGGSGGKWHSQAQYSQGLCVMQGPELLVDLAVAERAQAKG